jgi:hypothetical protein
LRTAIPVITWLGVVRVDASGLEVAAVGGAEVVVVAGDLTAFACPGLAGVTAGAGVAVIACDITWFKDTSGLAATIVGARVAVVAGKAGTSRALSILA